MRHIFVISLLGVLFASVAASDGFAKQPCPEGATATGECVKPGLAKLMRWQTILMTQSRLSYTAPLGLPGDKSTVPPPRPIFEADVLSQPGTRR